MDINFMLMFFASKKLAFVTTFLCSSPANILELYRESERWGIRLRARNLQNVPELPAYDAYREGVLLDVNCPDVDRLLIQASSARAFNQRYTWLIFHDSPYNKSTIEEHLVKAVILPDADVTWYSVDTLIDVYKVKTDQPLIITNLGLDRTCAWNDLEATWRRLPTTVNRRRDLKNVFLRSATVITQPQHFKGWTTMESREIDTFPKLTYQLLQLCAEDLHFRYNMIQVDLYGEQRNGTFNGLVGLLQRNKIDIGISSMFIRDDRLPIVHFCSEMILIRGKFLFRQPPQSAVSNVFLLPFSRGVWAGSLILTAVTGVLLTVIGRVLHLNNPDYALLTPVEVFTFAIGTMCQQGFYRTPDLASARMVMFSALLMTLFAFTAYSAKIVVILQTPSDAIKTIGDILNSRMSVGVQETSYKRIYYAESIDPVIQKLYKRKLLPLGERAYLSVIDGIERMRTELFAFQVEQSSGYDIISKTFTEREKCGLKEIEAFRLPTVAVPIRKHSGYRDLLASRLRWQREVGLIDRHRRIWIADRPRCDANSAGFLSVGISDLLPAFQVLCCGALISLLLVFAEILAVKMKQHSINRHI
ncbi:ionotropic receptor 75a-like [Aphomia sociella]